MVLTRQLKLFINYFYYNEVIMYFFILSIFLAFDSIQNGDFISIHVDCSWTNSFVVSKRLFSLPVAADVEIGRGFYVSIKI